MILSLYHALDRSRLKYGDLGGACCLSNNRQNSINNFLYIPSVVFSLFFISMYGPIIQIFLSLGLSIRTNESFSPKVVLKSPFGIDGSCSMVSNSESWQTFVLDLVRRWKWNAMFFSLSMLLMPEKKRKKKTENRTTRPRPRQCFSR